MLEIRITKTGPVYTLQTRDRLEADWSTPREFRSLFILLRELMGRMTTLLIS